MKSRKTAVKPTWLRIKGEEDFFQTDQNSFIKQVKVSANFFES